MESKDLKKDIKNYLSNIIPASVVLVILGGFLGYAFFRISSLTENLGVLSTELASTTATLVRNTNELSLNITDLRSQTVGLSNTLSSTQQNVESVKNQVGGVEQTIGSISGTVNNLQKLSQIDGELLKKYSKVYFLNENYTPPHLLTISQQYIYSNTISEQFLTEAWPFLQKLLDAAKANGITLYVKSAYRSFTEQQTLKSTYSIIYGAGTANSFAADQGYSEHQLGTATDFITSGLGGDLTDAFDNTASFKWLAANAYLYGFEMSYPKDNTYYVYEPWHWRFVGVKLATYLHNNKLNFYDMDQRDISTYLINIFD
ncbi:MAG: M15 family metallopeptidase [Candidatus Paceibacterota bacterium]|jgi:D-alanyl-D-alanine carboxypeptidase